MSYIPTPDTTKLHVSFQYLKGLDQLVLNDLNGRRGGGGGGMYFWWRGCFREDLLVEFMYLVFTGMPGESYCRQLGSLGYIFQALVNSLVYWCRERMVQD